MAQYLWPNRIAGPESERTAMNICHYIAIGLFAIFAIADYLFRARRFPSVRAWKMLGVASMLLYFAIATFSPFLWDGWLGNHQLFDARDRKSTRLNSSH